MWQYESINWGCLLFALLQHDANAVMLHTVKPQKIWHPALYLPPWRQKSVQHLHLRSKSLITMTKGFLKIDWCLPLFNCIYRVVSLNGLGFREKIKTITGLKPTSAKCYLCITSVWTTQYTTSLWRPCNLCRRREASEQCRISASQYIWAGQTSRKEITRFSPHHLWRPPWSQDCVR